jgi:hypothetical protein
LVFSQRPRGDKEDHAFAPQINELQPTKRQFQNLNGFRSKVFIPPNRDCVINLFDQVIVHRDNSQIVKRHAAAATKKNGRILSNELISAK